MKKSKMFFILSAISIIITIILIIFYSNAISDRDDLYWLSTSEKENMDYGRVMYEKDTAVKYRAIGSIAMGMISISTLGTAIVLKIKENRKSKNKEKFNKNINEKYNNKYKELESLAELKEKGILTEEEFKNQKEKILK